MDYKLFLQAVSKLVLGFLLIAALLFIPAGTLRYWNAWLLMAILFVPMAIAGGVLLIRQPGLLRKRLGAGEKQAGQKRVVALSGLMFVCGFVAAGLDYRFGWLALPGWVTAAAAAAFLLGYLLYARVLRQNAYLSRTIEIQDGQKVVDTGLYGIVRHPMYTSTIVLFLSMPLVLGSLFSFFIFLAYPFLIAKRIKNEEQVLARGLEGYADYQKRVRYKVIPFVW